MMKSVWVLLSLLLLAGCASAPEVDYNEAMGKAVNAQEKQFHACYKKFGARKAMKTGIKYRLTYTGEIQFAEISDVLSENSPPAMDACMLDVFKAIKMPEVVGHDGVTGSYTFSYSSEK